jgi:hypothetical protein
VGETCGSGQSLRYALRHVGQFSGMEPDSGTNRPYGSRNSAQKSSPSLPTVHRCVRELILVGGFELITYLVKPATTWNIGCGEEVESDHLLALRTDSIGRNELPGNGSPVCGS